MDYSGISFDELIRPSKGLQIDRGTGSEEKFFIDTWILILLREVALEYS